MSDPQTEAGKLMVSRWGAIDLGSTRDSFARAVAAIEVEAAAAEMGRVAGVIEAERKPKEWFSNLDLYIGHVVAIDAVLRAFGLEPES